MTPRPSNRRAGQIALVLLFLILGLLFLFLLQIDIFSAARGKMRLQNAGDAAALAAARGQGVTLNLLGELNLLRLAAACETNREAVAGIAALQERIALAGPCLALQAANAAARENLWKITPPGGAAEAEMDAMRGIVEFAAAASAGRTSDSWPEKGADYAAMLRAAVADGCWAGADNAAVLPAVTVQGFHPLFSRAFYDAADSQNWPRICMTVFRGNHAQAVATLLNWPGWGALPDASATNDFDNAEFYGVGVRRAPILAVPASLHDIAAALADLAEKFGLDTSLVTPGNILASGALDDPVPWFFLDPALWREWSELDITHFPLRAPVRDAYNVKGAAAAARVCGELATVSETAVTNLFSWTAAAKPFGDLDGRRVTDLFGSGDDTPALVTPAFTFVRLIPLGGVGDNSLGAADPAWLEHVRVHVPNNIRDPACRFCRVLDKWDDPAYTRAGGLWLQNHAHTDVCVPPAHGHGPGGGTRHAH